MRMLAAALAMFLVVPVVQAADIGQPEPLAPPVTLPAPQPMAQPFAQPDPNNAGPPPLPAAGPPPMPIAPAEYWVGENGQQVGPMSLEQLLQRIREGRTTREDLVWKTGLANWAAAQSFAELLPAFQERQPPPLPPEASFRQTLIGNWESSWDMQGYFMTLRVTYGADGRYAGTMIATPPGGAPMQAPVYGSWSIQPTGQDTLTLTLTDSSGATSTHQIRILDDRTLENLGTGVRSRKIAG